LRGGDRTPDGTLERPGADPDTERTTSLLALRVALGHHLVVFAASGKHKSVDEGALEWVAEGFLERGARRGKVHRVSTQGAELGSGGYLDGEGELHGRYGFVEPGYVLVRPDGRVAHIGLLSAMDKLLLWLESYLNPT
jgi:hypothetical protein